MDKKLRNSTIICFLGIAISSIVLILLWILYENYMDTEWLASFLIFLKYVAGIGWIFMIGGLLGVAYFRIKIKKMN